MNILSDYIKEKERRKERKKKTEEETNAEYYFVAVENADFSKRELTMKFER